MYIGLQGSYLRGEATENGNIDIMAVIDEITDSGEYDFNNAFSVLFKRRRDALERMQSCPN